VVANKAALAKCGGGLHHVEIVAMYDCDSAGVSSGVGYVVDGKTAGSHLIRRMSGNLLCVWGTSDGLVEELKTCHYGKMVVVSADTPSATLVKEIAKRSKTNHGICLLISGDVPQRVHLDGGQLVIEELGADGWGSTKKKTTPKAAKTKAKTKKAPDSSTGE
jgi:hypothetical protein